MSADRETGETLLRIAHHAIDAEFGLATGPALEGAPSGHPGASFVTLTLKGRLRGCIGSLEAWRALADDVAANARAAAFRDPRFAPLTPSEWADTRVEVSLLSPAEPISFSSEADALAQLRPNHDGVILTLGSRRATFLPQVWESLPDPRQFMAQLKLKAGLAADFWDDGVTLARYSVRKWKED